MDCWHAAVIRKIGSQGKIFTRIIIQLLLVPPTQGFVFYKSLFITILHFARAHGEFLCGSTVKEKRPYQGRHYSWPGFRIKIALPQAHATVTSPGPVNRGLVYPTKLSPTTLGP